jgi:hypothetical protein
MKALFSSLLILAMVAGVSTLPQPAQAAKTCCKRCSAKSKPCGDTCISKSKTCHKGKGCACGEDDK